MHKYMRAIGFSEVWSRKELQKLLTDVVVEGKERAYTSNGDETLLASFSKEFAPNIGVTVCGEFDEDDKFVYEYFCVELILPHRKMFPLNVMLLWNPMPESVMMSVSEFH